MGARVELVLPLPPLSSEGLTTDQLELMLLQHARQKSQRKQMKRLLVIHLVFIFSAFAVYPRKERCPPILP